MTGKLGKEPGRSQAPPGTLSRPVESHDNSGYYQKHTPGSIPVSMAKSTRSSVYPQDNLS